MATLANGMDAARDPRAVGNAFVDQYYNVLNQSPHMLHRFYTDISELSRPGLDGEMTSVTSMQGINDKILSMGFEKYHLQILTADAQASHKGGVSSALVTGRLTGEDDIMRTFSQSFFLAPQDNGFFILNDIFRYVEGESTEPISASPEELDAKSVEVSITDPGQCFEAE
ncbi:hypothetical protein MLD38_024349 [Melastoma candidum]|uniref:Uncharacterized protein n=1 Tax=Melastoma candidum TaxID=119954 RepID=A0ACB9NS16_9MYRT|nr:hypothetical protein MLD38_024349 [Melastoma candidum]